MDSPSAPVRMVLARDLVDRAETRQQHARAARRGREVRIGRGAYVDRDAWDELSPVERDVLRLRAYARTRAVPPVFSHWSAVALHGLPFAGERGEEIHIAVGPTAGGRSGGRIRAHSVHVPPEDIVEVAGLQCTSRERTVIDIAAGGRLPDAVAVADAVLRDRRRGPGEADDGREALLGAWLRAQPQRGHRRSLEAVALADGRAESPLESLSRVVMYRSGMPRPELQRPFSDGRGRIGFADFAWPDHRVIGEADGAIKYLDAELRAGRSAEQVVVDEKVREDRLRALGWRVVRWTWADARQETPLVAALTAAGVPADPTHRWADCALP
ncbi:hypothetical protein [Leifsonia sp. C5G2]|uniref:hypothetical protein n=1 Tax=Leifsonia sp. C5G2 TaxID=2735269 RepID=UPI00158485D8|nr:hypothetical protein [Leifsonia sp. C5G2]NUU07003.1 hypothetical protein [Leifsonia sp. C5G2]